MAKTVTATATEEEPEEYKNWIELAIGGVITSGDRAQFEQEHRLPGDQVYGGIQDLHFEGTVGKDGALFDRWSRALGFQRLRHNRAIGEAESRLHQGWLHRVSQLVRWQRRVLPAQ